MTELIYKGVCECRRRENLDGRNDSEGVGFEYEVLE